MAWSATALLAIIAVAGSGCGGGSSRFGQGSTSSATTASHYEGGEKSIEDFGAEAKGSDRAALVGAFHSYLGALAARDYEAACSRLSAPVHHSLEQLAGKSSRGFSCAAILPRLLAPTAAAIARRQTAGHVTKVRVEGDRAFVVFHAPGAKLYQLTMAREGGRWTATTVAASVLVPSAASLGQ